MPDDVQVRSLDEARTHIASLTARALEVERRLRVEEEWTDTYLATPAWKRWLFIADGWPGHRLVERPAWRPWRRWWES